MLQKDEEWMKKERKKERKKEIGNGRRVEIMTSGREFIQTIEDKQERGQNRIEQNRIELNRMEQDRIKQSDGSIMIAWSNRH